jgi:hypothetical protein
MSSRLCRGVNRFMSHADIVLGELNKEVLLKYSMYNARIGKATH